MTAKSQVKTIRALARGLEVLRLLQAAGALTLDQLHRRTGLPKATLLRILKTLAEQGAVWRRMVDGAYVPSFSLQEQAGRMNQEHRLVEIASPVLAALTERIEWPSVLAAPRLTHMEVIETNAPRAQIEHIPLGPVGFRVNMLRSASGRAYIAYCDEPTRAAILDALRRSPHPGDRLARNDAYVARLIEETRARGHALRDPDFGGDFDEGRRRADDERDSLGAAIRLGDHAAGAINVTWSRRALARDRAEAMFAAPALDAAAEIARGLSGG